MKIIYNPVFLEHNTGDDCVENKGRLDLVVEAIEAGDISTGDLACINQGQSFFEFGEGLGHNLDHVSRIKDLCAGLNPNNTETESIDEERETFVSYNSFKAAQMALSCAISAAWMTKRLAENTFALVRPPGHHAYSDKSHGFCIFNNMAVAAEYLARQGERVLVVDIDLHHGDGTQSMLASSNSHRNLHYFSIHQEDTWPSTGSEDGFNATNIVVKKETPEEEYIRLMQENLERPLRSLRPTLVGISAGFDAYHIDDDESIGNTLCLTDKAYKALLDTIAPIPFFAVLEGGYNPQSVLEGVLAFYEWDKARSAAHEKQFASDLTP